MRCTIGTTVVMTGLVVAMLAFRPDMVDDPGIVKAQDGPNAEAASEEQATKDKGTTVIGSAKKSHNERANDVTRRKLDTLIDVDFKETSLGNALSAFAKKVGLQFYIDPKGLEDLVITTDDPITLNLQQVPAEMALDLILRPLQLAYTLRSGVVMVSSQAEIDASPETRVYYVSADSTYELIQLIPSTVAPNTWAAVGGLGAIVPFRDSLVISQTSETHQDIEKLLKDLEPVLAKGPRKRATEDAAGAGYGAADGGGYGAPGYGYGGASRGGYGAGEGYGAPARGGYGGGGGQPGYGQSGGGGGGYGRAGYGEVKQGARRTAETGSPDNPTPSGKPAASK